MIITLMTEELIDILEDVGLVKKDRYNVDAITRISGVNTGMKIYLIKKSAKHNVKNENNWRNGIFWYKISSFLGTAPVWSGLLLMH